MYNILGSYWEIIVPSNASSINRSECDDNSKYFYIFYFCVEVWFLLQLPAKIRQAEGLGLENKKNSQPHNLTTSQPHMNHTHKAKTSLYF